MNETMLDELEIKYKDHFLKGKELMISSQTPGAYLGYKSQCELIAIFLFDINELREHPKPMEDILP